VKLATGVPSSIRRVRSGISSATREDRPLRSSRVLGPMRFTISASGVNLGAHCASRVRSWVEAPLASSRRIRSSMMVSLSATSVSTPASKVPCAPHRSAPQPAQEFIEDGVLERDRQRQNAVEPALDRREIVGEAAFLLKLEAGALAKSAKPMLVSLP
jgi:hypothetical protein